MTRGYRRGPVIPEQKETINGLMLGATQRRSAIPSGRMVTKGYGCVSTSTGGDAPTTHNRCVDCRMILMVSYDRRCMVPIGDHAYYKYACSHAYAYTHAVHTHSFRKEAVCMAERPYLLVNISLRK